MVSRGPRAVVGVSLGRDVLEGGGDRPFRVDDVRVPEHAVERVAGQLLLAVRVVGNRDLAGLVAEEFERGCLLADR